MIKVKKLSALVLIAALSIGAGKPAPVNSSAARNWTATVTETPEAYHIIGNPDAKVRLTEFVSYTCSHCAQFEKDSETSLTLGFVRSGKGSIEYRNVMRNNIDLAVSLMVQCGAPARFRGNHTAVLRSQSVWMRDPGPAEQRRWANDDFPTAMRAIASDLHLYPMFEQRGYTRTQLEQCLSDWTMGKKLVDGTNKAFDELNIQGTPTFLINGEMQITNTWAGIRPVLMAMTK